MRQANQKFRIWNDRRSRRCRAVLVCLFAMLAMANGAQQASSNPASPAGPRSKVVIAQDPQATEAYVPRMEIIQNMVSRAMTNLTGKATPSAAWLSLVTTQDTVGLKVLSAPGPNSGTRPAVVAAVIEELLAAGLPTNHIIVWDRQATDLRLSGFYDLKDRYGVRVAGSVQSGYDENAYYDTSLLGNLVFGDLEFGKQGQGVGRKSFVSKLASKEMTKIINITPLLNNNDAGVSGNLWGLAMGSVDNIVRFEGQPARLAMAVPEIYALSNLSDHVVMSITDALICQYEGGERGLLHYSTTLNQLRFSRDAVALDLLSLQDLERQRKASSAPTIKQNMELYNNAALLELGVSDPKRIQVETLGPAN